MHLARRAFKPGPDHPNQVWIHSLHLSLILIPNFLSYTALVLLHSHGLMRGEGRGHHPIITMKPMKPSKYAAPLASTIDYS